MMMDLFQYAQEAHSGLGQKPLADFVRPQTLEDIIGQPHLIETGTPLRNMLAAKHLPSILLWGPPGVGKTTLARLLAREVGAELTPLSAVSSGVKELREAVQAAQERRRLYQQKTVVFIDEIHRFNKTQQDALLPHVENGDITLLGATTENPYFSVNPALRSRLLLLTLNAIAPEALVAVVKRAVNFLNQHGEAKVSLEASAEAFLLKHANGDARSLLTVLDAAYFSIPRDEAGNITVTEDWLRRIAPFVNRNSGKGGKTDSHYDLASAYQKSLRGSDVDAALYWLAKFIAYGEDPRFIARRLVVTAAEDVGMADPQAFVLAQNAAKSIETLGMPEGRIPLALATAYVAKAPKSNASYKALGRAMAAIEAGEDYPVPLHLRDKHNPTVQEAGGRGYIYTHDNPVAPQTFLPDALLGQRFYEE